MVNNKVFKLIVKNTPLISIDLCIICDGQILLGKRLNEPLKGIWFTPGGRIYKNESWQSALKRICLSELGLNIEALSAFTLMGVWDHFYPNSVFGSSTSTHYVNLPHVAKYSSKPEIKGDCQHEKFAWFDFDEVSRSDEFNKYTKIYVNYIATREAQFESN